MKAKNSLVHPYSTPLIVKSLPISALIIAVFYILLDKFSFFITVNTEFACPIFFPAGLALASVLIMGRKAIPGIAIGAVYSNAFLNTVIANQNEMSFFSRLSIGSLISMGTIIASITVMVILNRVCKKRHLLNKGQNVLCLLFLGPITYSTITSLVSVTSLMIFGVIPSVQFWHNYTTWWFGDIIGIILICPLLLSWFLKESFLKSDLKLIELTLFGTLTILLCTAVFFQLHDLKYLIFPLLFWSAYRFPIQITTIVIFIISLFAIITTAQGIGPFNEEQTNDSILFLDLFLSTISICTLFLAGIISERKKAEDSIKTSENNLRKNQILLESTIESPKNFSIYSLGRDYEYLSFNQQHRHNMQLMFGIDIKLGMRLQDCKIEKEELDIAVESINKAFLGESITTIRYFGINNSYWEFRTSPINQNGTIIGATVISTNITQRKEDEREIAFQNQKLQIQNKELEQFAYITSHDLQEPLLTLKYFSELIKADFPRDANENISQYLDFILESSDRMQKLVKGLLDYTRIGRLTELTEIDCNEIVKDAVNSLSESIKETGTLVTVEDLPQAEGYSAELIQLFQQLIENAIKFRKKETPLTINISIKSDDNNWIFAVKDNGIGVEENNKEKIFIIFKRLNDRQEYPGIGIGLALCKKIIALHGGEIWIESALGQGSVIYFTIPKEIKNNQSN